MFMCLQQWWVPLFMIAAPIPLVDAYSDIPRDSHKLLGGPHSPSPSPSPYEFWIKIGFFKNKIIKLVLALKYYPK